MKEFLRNTWKHRAHVIMALPVFLILFFIMYVPMAGSFDESRSLGQPGKAEPPRESPQSTSQKTYGTDRPASPRIHGEWVFLSWKTGRGTAFGAAAVIFEGGKL